MSEITAYNQERIVHKIMEDSDRALTESLRPCVIFKAELRPAVVGEEWEALYSGYVIGVGTTPDEAMRNFDLHWTL